MRIRRLWIYIALTRHVRYIFGREVYLRFFYCFNDNSIMNLFAYVIPI